MSLGDRLGIAGVIVALIGIAAFYLWPDKKWIGWLSLVFAAGLLLGWTVLEIKQKCGINRASLTAALAAGALVGVSTAAIIWYSLAPATPASPTDFSVQHIQPTLIIDYVKARVIGAYRLSVTNIGTESITEIRVSFTPSPVRSPGMIDEMFAVATTLPPHGGRVSVAGVHPEALSEHRQLYAIFTFKSKIKGDTFDFVSSNHFVLPEGPIKPQAIDPDTFYEFTGDLRNGANAAIRDDLRRTTGDALSKWPQGSLSFWAQEKRPDGSPNYVAFTGNRLALVYDPVVRAASLIPRVVGKPLVISFGANDRHMIAANWDKEGPSLISVDGKFVTRQTSQ